MGFDGTRAEMLGCFFARKITVIILNLRIYKVECVDKKNAV